MSAHTTLLRQVNQDKLQAAFCWPRGSECHYSQPYFGGIDHLQQCSRCQQPHLEAQVQHIQHSIITQHHAELHAVFQVRLWKAHPLIMPSTTMPSQCCVMTS